MIKKLIINLILGLLLGILLIIDTGCNRDPFRVDISGIAAPVEITRFEKILFSADPSTLEKSIPQWKNEFGIFFDHYCYIAGLGNTDEQDFPERLRAFVTDRYNYLIYNRTLQVFPDLNMLTIELSNAFRHYLYYFPQKPLPHIFTFISGLNQSAITDDSLLAIGLDRYLGANEPLYNQTGVYNYLKINMHPAKIASDCMIFWGETEFAFNDSVNNLITNMIYRGRNLYFTCAMLPDQADSLNLGFRGYDLRYLSSAEKSIWAFLIENKMLFSTDKFTINKYILEGPFTTDFGREAPARAAVWIGYRITEAFMKRNPSVSLQQLMEMRDYTRILNQSGYNP